MFPTNAHDFVRGIPAQRNIDYLTAREVGARGEFDLGHDREGFRCAAAVTIEPDGVLSHRRRRHDEITGTGPMYICGDAADLLAVEIDADRGIVWEAVDVEMNKRTDDPFDGIEGGAAGFAGLQASVGSKKPFDWWPLEQRLVVRVEEMNLATTP